LPKNFFFAQSEPLRERFGFSLAQAGVFKSKIEK
jgi:hypothetical protein